MLTSYLVRCPHPDCNWFGSLLPEGRPEAWRNSTPNVRVVTFLCPRCQREWQGRVVGDDVQPLPLEEMAVPLA
jgi:hypothetical protein